jgi:hypothetical protein
MAEVVVAVDDIEMPHALLDAGQLVDPGRRKVTGQRGAVVVEEVVEVQEGERKTVTLRFGKARSAAVAPAGEGAGGSERTATSRHRPPSDGSAGSSQRTWGWVSAGVGAAGLAVGGVTALMATSKRSALLDGGCEAGQCYTDQASDIDSYDTLRALSTAGFVLGGVGVALGSVLLLTAPSDEEPPTAGVQAWIGIGSVGVKGKF